MIKLQSLLTLRNVNTSLFHWSVWMAGTWVTVAQQPPTNNHRAGPSSIGDIKA